MTDDVIVDQEAAPSEFSQLFLSSLPDARLVQLNRLLPALWGRPFPAGEPPLSDAGADGQPS
jgi:hypothetical protein